MATGSLPGPCVVIPQWPAYGSGAAQVSFPELEDCSWIPGKTYLDLTSSSPTP